MEALSTQNSASVLLADKARLSTTDARFYLAARMRTRTPGGSAEYLKVRATHEPQAWDARVKLSLDLMSIYRELFPCQYHASRSPQYSTAREHELYRLVNQYLFPLCLSEDRGHIELERKIAHDPNFLLPYIPVAGTQQHDWIKGCCHFERIQLVFQLVLILSHHPLGRRFRDTFLQTHGLAQIEVAPPLGAYGWTHYQYWLTTSDTWLKFLPLAFNMVSYKTGTPWLDIPPSMGAAGVEWTPAHVAKLFESRRKAEAMNEHVLQLDGWLRANRVGIVLALQLWNDAAQMEREAGLTGALLEDIPARLERMA